MTVAAVNDFAYFGNWKYKFELKLGGGVADEEEIKLKCDNNGFPCQFATANFSITSPGQYHVKETAFQKFLFWWIKQNDFETDKFDITLNETQPLCPVGNFDGDNCFVLEPPAGTEGFIYEGALYYTANPQCTRGSFDGANCFIGDPVTQAFKYDGNLYYKAYSGNSCPIPGTWYDGANCFAAPASEQPFIYNGNLYVKPKTSNNCSAPGSHYDGANCFVYKPPTSSEPFIYNDNLYYKPICN